MLPTFPKYCGCLETNLAGQQVSSEERSERTAGAAAWREPSPGPPRHACVTPPRSPPSSLLLNRRGSRDVFLGGGGRCGCSGAGCAAGGRGCHGERFGGGGSAPGPAAPPLHLSVSPQPSAPFCKRGSPQSCHRLRPWRSTVWHVPEPSQGSAVFPWWPFAHRSHSRPWLPDRLPKEHPQDCTQQERGRNHFWVLHYHTPTPRQSLISITPESAVGNLALR